MNNLLKKFKGSKSNIKFRLLIVLGVYIALIIIFSFIYQEAFNNDHRHFTFNHEIREIRREIDSEYIKKLIAAVKRDIDKRNNYLELLKPILNNNDPSLKTIFDENESKIILSERQYVVAYRYPPRTIIVSSKDPPESTLIMIIKDNKAIREKISIPNAVAKLSKLRKLKNDEPHLFIGETRIEIPKNINDYKILITDFKNHLANEIGEIESFVERESKVLTEPWSYWDFLYFSTITQTTVGYGDILPNATYVRIIVILQVLIGVLFIGLFAVYFVSPK